MNGLAMSRRKLQPLIAGMDGAITQDVPVRITQTRVETRGFRSKPGTFEWRYGRKSADGTLYHAGCHYATLWERAGTAAASSPDLEAIGGGAWKGLPDGRASAMSTLREAFKELGKLPTSRLTAYCVDGRTTAEIARQNGTTERNMAPVLDQDLRACALHFHFLSNRR